MMEDDSNANAYANANANANTNAWTQYRVLCVDCLRVSDCTGSVEVCRGV